MVLNDRVKETTTTTGTGTLNLGGAVTNFQTFVAGIGNGNTTYYAIVDATNGAWEVGMGTVTDAATDTLSRTTVLSSSNSNALVSLSAGTKDVFCTIPGSWFPQTYSLRSYNLLGGTALAEPIGISQLNMSTVTTLTDGQVRYIAVFLPQAAKITGVRWFQGTQGNYTADNNNRIGLCTYAGGNLTRVASCANDANLWKTASTTWTNKAFSAQYDAAPGIYYVELLYNNSAQVAAPVLGAFPALQTNNMTLFDFANSAKIMGSIAAQTDLPTSPVAMTGIAANGSVNVYVALY